MGNVDEAIKMLISCGLSNYRIAKETGISPTTLTNYRTGRTKPTAANARMIIQYLSNRPAGRTEAKKRVQEVMCLEQTAEYPPKAVFSEGGGDIPLVPVDAVAGALSGNSIPVMDYDCEHYNVPLFKGAEFLIQITGDSMQPKYYSGDIVACKRLRIDTFFQWNRSYVVDSEQGILLKRILPGHDDRHLTLVSDNSAYPPFELPREDIYSIALVVGVIRAE